MERLSGVLALFGAIACGVWFGFHYFPRSNEVAWAHLTFSCIIGVFLTAWAMLLLRTPIPLRRVSSYVITFPVIFIFAVIGAGLAGLVKFHCYGA